MNITINPNELLAVALMAGKNDLRQYLNGVNVEVKDKNALIVASNGHNLAALILGGCDCDDISFIIPMDLIKNIKKSTKSDNKLVFLSFDPETSIINLKQSSQTFMAQALSGNYPNWKQVIPAPFVPGFNFYQMHLMAVFEKAGKLLAGKPVFYQNGEDQVAGVVEIKLSDDRVYMGLIMPFKPGIEKAAEFTPAYTA